MSATPVTASTGATAQGGALTVTRVIPAQTNDLTHVALNPDEGRIELTDAQGYKFTSTPSTSVSSSAGPVITLVKEAQ